MIEPTSSNVWASTPNGNKKLDAAYQEAQQKPEGCPIFLFFSVKLEHGLQVIKIFKDHASKKCILDDFDFYEDIHKKIQEKKAKQHHFQNQAQVWEGKPAEEKNKENTYVSEAKTQKTPSYMFSSDFDKETANYESRVTTVSGDRGHLFRLLVCS